MVWLHFIPGCSLTASSGSAAVEKQPKSLRGFSEGSAQGKAERYLLIGVSNLTIKMKK
jgi:hypothetical protein